jgi:hypothetical protein
VKTGENVLLSWRIEAIAIRTLFQKTSFELICPTRTGRTFET